MPGVHGLTASGFAELGVLGVIDPAGWLGLSAGRVTSGAEC